MTMDEIKRKYDEIVIRCALGHIVDVGMQNLSDDTVVEETIRAIQEKEENRKGGIPVIGADFQIAILRAASDISKTITPADLFVWARNNLEFSGTKDEVKFTNNKHCPTCGEPLEELCPHCYEVHSLSWANYCPNCGQKIEFCEDYEGEWEEDDDCD